MFSNWKSFLVCFLACSLSNGKASHRFACSNGCDVGLLFSVSLVEIKYTLSIL